jgi:hypothetical protein
MSNDTARTAIHRSRETGWSHAQASAEGDALHGTYGPERQLVAMSGFYLELRAAGHPATPAIKAAVAAGDRETALNLILAAIRLVPTALAAPTTKEA